jgi:hypothetical protein
MYASERLGSKLGLSAGHTYVGIGILPVRQRLTVQRQAGSLSPQCSATILRINPQC